MPKRFEVDYLVSCDENETIHEKALAIALEQSVELPSSVINDAIRFRSTGHIEKIESSQHTNHHWVTISYPVDNFGHDLTQFLNTLIGNSSLKPGIQVINVDWQSIFNRFPGPSFGVDGIRANLGIKKRPLACTAIKPLGFNSHELADLCYHFAKGGIDIIKDDHGIADQKWAPFSERVKICTEAIRKGNQDSGNQAHYYPNITTRPDRLIERYHQAVEAGADGVLLCPHLTGLEMMAVLTSESPKLPIMAHPAFSGTFVVSQTGFSHSFMFGSLWRAFGADFVIYPNNGGRFSFTLDECIGINQALLDPQTPFARAFPTPGGGMQCDNVNQWIDCYGNDIVILMGGSLYRSPHGIECASQKLRETLESAL